MKTKLLYATLMFVLSIAMLFVAPNARITWDRATIAIFVILPLLGFAASFHTLYYCEGLKAAMQKLFVNRADFAVKMAALITTGFFLSFSFYVIIYT